ncbi:MAG: hypothetical protein V8S31_10155 [Lachnospiraceae bacterium]
MEKAKLSLSIDCFPMQCFVWRLLYSIIDTVTEILLKWNFAIDKNVSKRRTKIDYPFIKAYRVESELVTLGETEGEIDFHKVRIYDRDRTICDVLRNMNKMDKEVFNKAVQGYVKDPKKNIPNLIEYAKVLRVQTRVKELIGVWL